MGFCLFNNAAVAARAFIAETGENVLIANPRDIPGLVGQLRKRKFTTIYGVNTLFNALLHAPGFDQVDFSSLRSCGAGGMAMAAEFRFIS